LVNFELKVDFSVSLDAALEYRLGASLTGKGYNDIIEATASPER